MDKRGKGNFLCTPKCSMEYFPTFKFYHKSKPNVGKYTIHGPYGVRVYHHPKGHLPFFNGDNGIQCKYFIHFAHLAIVFFETKSTETPGPKR